MKESSPKVSVITTVYNCEKYIARSVESILNQTYRDFEFIIVNDGSIDNTSLIVRELSLADNRIVFIDNKENKGRVPSLNKALEIAKGKYLAIQDADDYSMPERLEKQITFLENNNDYVLVGSNIIVMDENEKFISQPMRPINSPEAKFNLLFRCTFANPSIVFRKEIVDKYGLKYEDNFIHAEDYRIISKISNYGKVYNLEEMLVKYRKHSFNNSMVYSDIVSNGSTLIAKENVSGLGIEISEEQALRIRKLLSSKGTDLKYIYNDVKLLLKIMKEWQSGLAKKISLRNRSISYCTFQYLNSALWSQYQIVKAKNKLYFYINN
ncbi:MAG TPA: glycosyltransferase family 2 protein [Ignavibacteria bacterium]|nr:glycosyltransferase family 2 protein [Ignavibacteria bacterium]